MSNVLFFLRDGTSIECEGGAHGVASALDVWSDAVNGRRDRAGLLMITDVLGHEWDVPITSILAVRRQRVP